MWPQRASLTPLSRFFTFLWVKSAPLSVFSIVNLLTDLGWDSKSGPVLAPQSYVIYQILKKSASTIHSGKRKQLQMHSRCRWFPSRNLISSFSNWQLTTLTTCGKSFITLGRNQTINSGLFCPKCAEVRGTGMTFQAIQRSSRTLRANWLNGWTSAKEIWIMRL